MPVISVAFIGMHPPSFVVPGSIEYTTPEFCRVGYCHKKTRLKMLSHRLRRVSINPRYHSNCTLPCHFRLYQALSLYAAFTGSVYFDIKSFRASGSEGMGDRVCRDRPSSMWPILCAQRGSAVFVIAFGKYSIDVILTPHAALVKGRRR